MQNAPTWTTVAQKKIIDAAASRGMTHYWLTGDGGAGGAMSESAARKSGNRRAAKVAREYGAPRPWVHFGPM